MEREDSTSVSQSLLPNAKPTGYKPVGFITKDIPNQSGRRYSFYPYG
jgi:hypothetical protein